MPHIIRLRGPWEHELLECFGATAPAALPPGGRVQLPTDWSATLGNDFRGRVRYRRRFNRPTGLDASERVYLVVEGVDARGSFALNEQPLGAINGYALPAECDVTELLANANILTIDVELPATSDVLRPGREQLAGGPIGEVRLEIRGLAHVDGLAVYCEPGPPARLCVTGSVASAMSDVAMAIIVTACDREMAYSDVAAGVPFLLTAAADDFPAWPDAYDESVLTPVEVRLLVAGRTVWQAARETAPPQPAGEPARRTILAAIASGGPCAWADYLTEDDERIGQLLQHGASNLVGLRGISTDSVYTRFDRANVAVVQHMPPAWASAVCPRLAHHPSIVAWSARRSELASADQTMLTAAACGRPWVATDE